MTPLPAQWSATALSLALLALPVPTQVVRADSPFVGVQERVARIGRVATEEAPVLDGFLTDPCWRDAPEIGTLVQVEPWQGKVPEHRTVVRLLHDRKAIYLAIQCFDARPDEIRATLRERDANLDPDDRVEWLFDPFNNNRIAYWFQIGAGGSRGDALLGDNGNRFNKSWDTIWDGRVRRSPRGWQAEVRIPFQSIGRREGAASWGFNLLRHRRVGGEEYRWANPFQGRRFWRVSEAGVMTGIGEVDPGRGIDFVPYVSYAARRTRSVDKNWTSDPDAGGDFFYRITPELTLATTVFTDFAETENDSRQINLNRFPLFFPEKRDFFLEDAARFEFGVGGRRGRGSGLIPFFSRRIGLADGEQIPIIAGIKLTGELGPLSIGLLDVETDESAALDRRRNLGVLRLSHNLGAETTVGFIGTNGRPAAAGENAVIGVDVYHREPDFVGDMDLRLWAYGLSSQTSGVGGDGNAFGFQAQSQGAEWDWTASTRWITSEFNPELGFLRRSGVKEHELRLSYRPRQGGEVLRNLVVRGSIEAIYDEGNELEELELDLRRIGLETHEGDEFGLTFSREFQRVDQDFTIFDDTVTIFAGRYWESRMGWSFETSSSRPVSLEFAGSVGDFFNGESTSFRVELAWRPDPLLMVSGEYRQTEVELPGAEFTTLVAEGNLDLHFSPRVGFLNLVQYDNESRNLSFQSRLRWIIRPGSDLFLVASGGWAKGVDGNFRPEEQSLVIKVLHTIRF